MPYTKEHTVRIMEPEKFQVDSFRRKEIESGLELIMGKLIGSDSMTAQSYRFAVDKFSIDQIKDWIKEHKIDYISIEEAKEIKAFQESILLRGKIQAFSENEILKKIPSDILEEIKKKDEHPVFKAYILAHEGTSEPRIIGERSKPITWGRKAIESIKSVIKKGIKFFKGHNADNTIDNRESLGEVITTFENEKDGQLQTVVIGYFPKEKVEEVKNYDVCSMEANWNIFEEAGKWIAEKIEALTGIALQSSDIEKPAFSGARTLGMVQAFKEIQGMAEITLQEIKRAVRDMNIFPSQLFKEEDIIEDVGFKKLLTKSDMAIEELTKKVKTLEEEKKQVDGKYTELLTESKKNNASKKYLEMLKDSVLKLTEKEKNFLEKRITKLDKFEDEDIKKFVEEQRAVYKEVASLVAGDGKTELPENKSTDKNDFTKPENNELLGGKK